MTMLPIFKQGYLEHLAQQVRSGTQEVIDLYRAGDDFSIDPEGLIEKTHLEVGAVPVLEMGDAGKASTDAENAIKLFEFLPDMNPVEAVNKRLWAYLTHGLFFDYCRWRWPFTKSNPVNHILAHWFFGRGNLRRNAISRLWWAAEFTHAPWEKDEGLKQFEKEDHFFYTRILLENQDIYQGIIERLYGHNLSVRICALDTLDRYRDHGPALTTLATQFTRSLNLVACHTDLAGLETDALKDLCDRTVEQLADGVQ